MADADTALVQWLLDNGGPVIRYRTATELVDDPADCDLERPVDRLAQSAMVQQWLSLELDSTFRMLKIIRLCASTQDHASK